MTPAQSEARAERMGIMVFDGHMTEEEAQAYCDSRPEIYGIRDRKEQQQELI